MLKFRKVEGAFPGRTMVKNGRTRLTRVLGSETVQETSPFMLLEVLETENPEDVSEGFPWQPYEGIESFLYFFDSKRERGRAAADLRTPSWIACSNGMYKDSLPSFDNPVIGVQLWAWANGSTDAPLVASAGRTMLPTVSLQSATVRVVSGTFSDQLGAVVLPKSGVTILDVFMEPKAEFVFDAFRGDPLLVYVMEGDAFFTQDEDELYPQGRALTFSPGEKMYVHATHRGVRFLLVHAPDAGDNVPVLNMDAVQRSEAEWETIVKDQPR